MMASPARRTFFQRLGFERGKGHLPTTLSPPSLSLRPFWEPSRGPSQTPPLARTGTCYTSASGICPCCLPGSRSVLESTWRTLRPDTRWDSRSLPSSSRISGSPIQQTVQPTTFIGRACCIHYWLAHVYSM